MARYYNNRRNNFNISESQNVSPQSVGSNRVKNKRNDDDLIIDDTSVYEIDSECYERLRRARLNSRKNEMR